MGIKLKAQKIPFIIIEKALYPGGTWHYNTYPGCACDIPGILYAYSFEPKMDWLSTYPSAEEMMKYTHHVIAKYDLAKHIMYVPTRFLFRSLRRLWIVEDLSLFSRI